MNVTLQDLFIYLFILYPLVKSPCLWLLSASFPPQMEAPGPDLAAVRRVHALQLVFNWYLCGCWVARQPPSREKSPPLFSNIPGGSRALGGKHLPRRALKLEGVRMQDGAPKALLADSFIADDLIYIYYDDLFLYVVVFASVLIVSPPFVSSQTVPSQQRPQLRTALTSLIPPFTCI